MAKNVEFVGGPMCGDRCKAVYHAVGELVFLSKSPAEGKPFVHVYASERYGEDFVYLGTRAYDRNDAGRIMGTVP